MVQVGNRTEKIGRAVMFYWGKISFLRIYVDHFINIWLCFLVLQYSDPIQSFIFMRIGIWHVTYMLI